MADDLAVAQDGFVVIEQRFGVLQQELDHWRAWLAAPPDTGMGRETVSTDRARERRLLA